MSDQDTSKELHDFLTNDPDEAIGLATGMNADGTVNVQGENGSVNAIAATPCTTQPTLLQRANGTWYAFQSPNQTISDNTLISRRSRPNNIQVDTGPIKVLFYIRTAQGYDWYVGGDRKKPVQIYTTTTLPVVQFSNTGRGKNDWVAGFKFSDRVVNVYNNKIYTCTEPWTYLLNWIGFGNWVGTFQGSVRAIGQTYTDTSSSWSYESTSPLVFGSGSFNYTQSDNFQQTNNIYSVGNIGFAFNKTVDVTIGALSYEMNRTHEIISVQISNVSSSFITKIKDIRNQSSITPTYVLYSKSLSKKIINTEYQYSLNEDTVQTDTGVTGPVISGTRSLTVTPQISGKNAYIYQQEENVSNTVNGDRTETQENNLVFVNEKPNNKDKIDIPYNIDKFQSLNSQRGASLIDNNYYLVLPPANSGQFQQGLWQTKTLALYQNSSNIYKTPNAELKDIPVWKAVINLTNNTIEVEEDIKVNKFYPLSIGAVVIAASYYA